jgi:hypothetical protein
MVAFQAETDLMRADWSSYQKVYLKSALHATSERFSAGFAFFLLCIGLHTLRVLPPIFPGKACLWHGNLSERSIEERSKS